LDVYEITIIPRSGFGTPLKGDTIFGQFCWQVVYGENIFGKTLDTLLEKYTEKPFVVFSSAYPKVDKCYAFKTPDAPIESIRNLGDDNSENIKNRKKYKKENMFLLDENSNISSFKELSDESFVNKKTLRKKLDVYVKKNSEDISTLAFKEEEDEYVSTFTQQHNTINRLTGTTGEGFDPFVVAQQVYAPGAELVVFVGIEENMITPEQVQKAFEIIGETGFGKDASTGLGRFTVKGLEPIDLIKMGSSSPNACYTLGPCVPQKGAFEESLYSPFVRFGKHGDRLAKSKNPFKSPIIMADEGAVFIPSDRAVFRKKYIGRAVSNISNVETKTVSQGYSLYIPVNFEV